MKQSDDLFRLIKSMSKEEKRQFKLTATRYKGPKRYLRLFDAVDAQVEYDERALRARLGDERFARQLHVAKSYLYELILKTLRARHGEMSVESRIRQYLDGVEMLHSRRLFDQAAKLLRKARELAVLHDRDVERLQVLRWERILASESLFMNVTDRELREEVEEVRRIGDRTVRAWECHAVYAEIAKRYVLNGVARTDEAKKSARSILERCAYGGSLSELPFDARISVIRAELLTDFMTAEPERALESSRALLDLLAGRSDATEEYRGQYISALINYLVLCVRLRRYEEFPEVVDRLRAMETSRSHLRMKIFENASSIALWHAVHTGEFDRAGLLVNEVSAMLKRYDGMVNIKARMFYLYQFAYVYYAVGRYDRALEMLMTIHRDFPEEVRRDLHCFTRLLMLLVHYELGNMDLLEYSVRSLYRYLLRREELYRFERTMLIFLRKLGAVISPQELMESLHDLKKEFAELRTDPDERRAFDYFDFEAWLEAKITGRALDRVMRDRWERGER